MLIAIPSDTTDGLDSTVSEHFGHCAAFTLVTVADEAIGEVFYQTLGPAGCRIGDLGRIDQFGRVCCRRCTHEDSSKWRHRAYP